MGSQSITSTSEARWRNIAYEDALKPPLDMRLESALLTTYSAEMPAIVAALRAMGGFAEGDAKLGPRGLVQTLERVRGRVRIAVQRGRLRSNTRARIAGILDQFVHEVGMDEAVGSWHPKMALVHFRSHKSSSTGEPDGWRFWMGSRNLVAAENAELGLCLESTDGKKGTDVPGLAEAAAWLAQRAGYDDKKVKALRRQLQNLRWNLPEGCLAVTLSHHQGLANTTKLPLPSVPVEKLIVVSPFLDVATVSALGRWGDEKTSRTIVSTEEWFRKLEVSSTSPLEMYDSILAMSKPEMEGDDASIEPASQEIEEQADFAYRRLHAKLLGVKHGRTCTFWMGSANATNRGWSGRNVELTAKVEANLPVWQGLENWTKDLREVDRTALRTLLDLESEVQKKLNEERNRLAAAWSVTLSFEAEYTLLISTSAHHPLDPSIELSVRLMTQSGLSAWPRGQSTLKLPCAKLADRTTFVCIRLEHRDSTSAEWVQCCTVDIPLGKERDTAALGEYMGAANLLAWWRSLLRDNPFDSDEDQSWDMDPIHREGNEVESSIASDVITLEDMLRAWARDPTTFQRDGTRIAGFVQQIKLQNTNAGPALEELCALQDLWRMIGADA